MLGVSVRNLLLAAPLLTALVACSTTDKGKLEATQVVPSASAEVKVKGKENGNSQIVVEAKHLAQPQRIAPDRHAYVVWVQPVQGDARPQNVGVLRVGNDLEGKLETKVPYDEFNVFITAEPTGTVTSPSGEKILISNKVYKTAH